jgi:hypothetical protein
MNSSRPRALPDWSAVPGDSEDDRRFLNHRLAFFGAVLFSLSGAFVLLNVVLDLVFNGPRMRLDRALHIGATMMFGAEWLLCRTGRRSAAQLNLIDAGTLLAGLCMFAGMAASQPRPVDPDALRAVAFIVPLVMTLITLSTVVTRAIIVPGTARRTFWLSAVACLPGLFAAYAFVASAPPAKEGVAPAPAGHTRWRRRSAKGEWAPSIARGTRSCAGRRP